MSWRTWLDQISFLSLHHKNPPSLFTMLKSAGRFFIYEIHQAILITSRAFNYTEKPRIRLFWNDECRQILRSIGYYRLSGYLYPFLEILKTNHIYKRGSTLNGALSLYEFDREFRLLVFNQIERIEIAVRSAITNILCAETNDVFWISSPSYFANTEKFNRTKALIDKELQTSREDFISHFKRNPTHLLGCWLKSYLWEHWHEFMKTLPATSFGRRLQNTSGCRYPFSYHGWPSLLWRVTPAVIMPVCGTALCRCVP